MFKKQRLPLRTVEARAAWSVAAVEVGGSRYSLAEWFESAHSPPHVDLVLFAGDLGLDLNEQLCPTGRYKDRRAGQGDPSHPLSVTPRANDKRTLLSFNALLRRICKAKPMAHLVICGGNHDGLICSDDLCLACHRKQVGRCEWAGASTVTASRLSAANGTASGGRG